MRSFISASMVAGLAGAIYAATLLFAAVTPDLAAPAYVLILCLALLWAGKLFLAETVSWRPSPVHWAVLAFVVYAACRYFFSPLEYEARRDLIEISFSALIYFISASNLYRSRERSIFIWALLLLALFEALSGIWQFATKSPTLFGLERPEAYSHRAGGTFVCPNHLAGFLEIALGILVARLVFLKSSSLSVQQIALRKIVLAYGAVIVVAGLIMTLSRGGWIAACVALGTLLFWGGWNLRALMVRLAAVIVSLALLGGLCYALPPVRTYITMTFQPVTPKQTSLAVRDESLGGRRMLWAATWKIIQEHPAFGTGGQSWEWYFAKHRDPAIQTHPQFAHNDLLQFTSDYGLVGAGLIAAIVFCFFKHVRAMLRNHRPAEERSFAIGTALGLTSILLHSWYDFNMHIQANQLLLATVLGLTTGMENGSERFKRFELKPAFRYALGTALVFICAIALWFVTPAAIASRYANLGEASKEEANFDEAEVYFKKVISHDPKSWVPYTRLGDIYRTKSQWANRTNPEHCKQFANIALEYYAAARTLNPLNPDVPAGMGRCYELLGENDKALREYQHAVDLDPNNGFVVACLATFHRNLGENVQALALYKRSWLLNAYTGKMAWYNMQDLKEAAGEQ